MQKSKCKIEDKELFTTERTERTEEEQVHKGHKGRTTNDTKKITVGLRREEQERLTAERTENFFRRLRRLGQIKEKEQLSTKCTCRRQASTMTRKRAKTSDTN